MLNGLFGFIAIGKMGSIPEINQVLGRKYVMQGMGNGQASHTGIK